MDLEHKHRVVIEGRGYFQISWLPAHALYLPETNKAVSAWLLQQIAKADGDTKKLTMLAKDLSPMRVGVRLTWAHRKTQIMLQAMPVSWAQFLMMSDDEQKENLKSEQFWALAVACLVQTADNKFVLSFRSKNVSHYAQCYHISAAGYVDFPDNPHCFNLKTQVKKELEEEVGLVDGDYGRIYTLGLCRHLAPGSAHIEACYFTKTHLTGLEVLKKAEGAKDCWEGKLSLHDPEVAYKMMEEISFNPGGIATLFLTRKLV